jgi:N-acetylglucosaminyl-diphospho-decaprenol L-rhamnosyltransferase
VDRIGLDVVIVSFRSRDLVRRCLESVRAHAPARTVIHVVDNDSGDGTPAVVRDDFPEVDLVALGRNAGFGRASNLGARRGNEPYVLFLNPDAELSAGALDVLLAIFTEQPSVGIVGCRLERADGSVDHAGRRSFPTIAGALGHFTGLGRVRRAPPALRQYTAGEQLPGPVDAINGAFMLIRRDLFEELDGFDEGYWMYMEDLDLCRRARDAGWLTWYEPRVAVLHIKHGTSGRWRSARLTYAFHYGMHRFYRRHEAPRRSRPVNAAVYAGIWAKFAVSLSRNTVARLIDR